jgi:hypothetical protein
VWSESDLRAFARDGYVLARNAVPEPARATALARIDALLADRPPAPGHTGHHFYFEAAVDEPELLALLTGTASWELAGALTRPRRLQVPSQVQVALTFPPYSHRPGMGHIDGLSQPEPGGRPGTFTMLAGIVLSDQRRDDMGNLWVWPGSHHRLAAHLASEGPEALVASGGYPMVAYEPPRQVHAEPGDVLFASYLLSHNIGGNTSDVLRKTVYYRLKVDGHDATWRDYVRDELYEFDPVRAAAG